MKAPQSVGVFHQGVFKRLCMVSSIVPVDDSADRVHEISGISERRQDLTGDITALGLVLNST